VAGTYARKILVVGNGMVGHHFVEQLRGANKDCSITVIGGEPRPAYDRVHLSDVFAGKAPEALALTSREHYTELGVECHFGDPVAAIEPEQHRVSTAGGRTFCYDKLVLATGSYPFVPPIKGGDRRECLTYRTIDDLGAIRAQASSSRVGVVVGGGLLGLECANALKNLGLQTHVVEFAPGLMGVQLDDGGSQVLGKKIATLGVQVHTDKATREITDGDSCRLKMCFADDSELEADLIVFSAGIRPYDQLAKDCGLEVGERGGVVIDYHCRTSDSDIYAIGECALFGGRIFGLVAPGYRMAEAAASQLAGDPIAFNGADMSTKLKLLGVDVGSIGDAHGRTEGAMAYVYSNPKTQVYKRLVVTADSRTLLGAVLVGDCDDYDTLLQYYLNEIELPGLPEALILPRIEGVPLLGAAALPATATICSCHNVSKGAISTAFDSGCCSLPEVKARTKASTGCGGCAALLKSVVDEELSSRGMEVSTDICEHFPYTRQDLYHLVRVGEIHSFDALLQQYGRGLGCDICKPAVTSILASCWNDYVLQDPHRGLQDTNDHYLANMQKNGTYSIVPRVAGGEITPEKLIALGEVARDYNLYTKITGGQRIDLFGARSEQLPEIWERLIAAGFETGHAYAKSLRTVKSCVGSTWCRYGVLDSVGMAILIENRYKGLRSPHKLKSAVSGCTRECAEAQSKDFGVIATEHGWNLYVCGNGGMKPRHADLFATDLDDKELVRVIDRFLMFYVRTADRLQRTSVWMENLEGGLEYLRAVILEDSLGICTQLETQMQQIVDSYQCEWKTTVEDPDKVKLFSHFVNSDQGDSAVTFERERGQIRPRTAGSGNSPIEDILATG
jgi:nitrite reductase (NADH) large subunit